MIGVFNRMKNERLSDNTKVFYCRQCEKCIHWGKSGTPWDNKFDKGSCEKYPYPAVKPSYIINNRGPCPYREEE